jgi:hypothetical protein
MNEIELKGMTPFFPFYFANQRLNKADLPNHQSGLKLLQAIARIHLQRLSCSKMPVYH